MFDATECIDGISRFRIKVQSLEKTLGESQRYVLNLAHECSVQNYFMNNLI
jgi:hypothetical protein